MRNPIDYLVFPSGRRFMGYSVDDLKTIFLKSEIENPSVTVMATTVIKGNEVIALAEKQVDIEGNIKEPPRLIIYSPKKEKKYVINHIHLGNNKDIEIIQVAFTAPPSKVILYLQLLQ